MLKRVVTIDPFHFPLEIVYVIKAIFFCLNGYEILLLAFNRIISLHSLENILEQACVPMILTTMASRT